MRNPEPFDPQLVGRYTVIRVQVQYEGQSSTEKIFVALKHKADPKDPVLVCIKATSQRARYERSAKDLAGCVIYEPGELPFFNKKTVIAPDQKKELLHSAIYKEAQRDKYKILGKMPPDFHGRFVAAVKQSPTLSPREIRELLIFMGESDPK